MASALPAAAMRSEERATPRLEDECAATSSSTTTATGVGRLRDELNAVLLDQRKQHLAFLHRHSRSKTNTAPSTSAREPVTHSTKKTPCLFPATEGKVPAWSDLDTALGSLKFQWCATALGHAEGDTDVRRNLDCNATRPHHDRQSQRTARMSPTVVPRQVIECARRGKRHPHAEPAAQEEISRRCLTLWRTLTRTTVVARQLSRRAASHHRDQLARHAFHAWQLYWRDQQHLHHASGVVASRSNIALLGGAYRRWRRTSQFQSAHRALQRRRRRRKLRTVLLYWKSRARLHRRQSQLCSRSQARAVRTAWERWRQFTAYCHHQASREAVAQTHFLRCQWEKLVRQVQHRIKRRQIIENHINKRQRRTRETYFDVWIEFIDREKRKQLATKWYQERLLEVVIANWKAAHDRGKYIQRLEERACRKLSRRRLRRSLQHWIRTARYLSQRGIRLKHISTRFLIRRAFGTFRQLNEVMIERERRLETWKSRRALQIWLQRAGGRREIALRGETVARRYSKFIKRTVGWRPWRAAYQRSSGINTIISRRAQREVQRAWDALKAATAETHRRRSLSALILERVTSRHMKFAVSLWTEYTSASQVRRQRVRLSSDFYDAVLKTRNFSCWRRLPSQKRRQRAMNNAADGLIRKRVLRQWRVRADQLRSERAVSFDEADRYWRRSLVWKCLAVWSSFAVQQQSRLRRWAFVSWYRGNRLKRAQRALTAVARSLELCRRWHRWRVLVRHSAELQQRGNQLTAKHERLVKHSFLVDQWRVKTRRYQRARLIISVLGRKAARRRVLTQWKLWLVDRRKKHQATGFHEYRVLLRCLYNLHEFTVGRTRLADRHFRRRQLVQVWSAWLILWKRSKMKSVADSHYCNFKASRVLAYFQANANRTQTMRACRQRADRWRRTVMLQAELAHWYFAAQRLLRLRQAHKQVQVHYLGARHFRAWRLALAMKRKAIVAALFQRQVALRRNFDRWLQITKRRLVAVAMWRYATARIRSSLVLAAWRKNTAVRRRVRLGTEALDRRRRTRMLQICFDQWELMVAVEVLRLSCLQRRSIRWASCCWTHWRRRVAIRRLCLHRRSKILESSFAGLQRFATRQRAGRVLCQQSARAAMTRALRVWRVEFRLARVQRSVSRAVLQQCLRDWMQYVSGCRQQREWIRYIQRLHQVHETNDECGLNEDEVWKTPKRRKQVGYRDELKPVLHAWYLATKSSQRRRQRGISPLSSASITTSSPMKMESSKTGSSARHGELKSKGERGALDASNRMLALRFWSDHLVSRAFKAWKHRFKSRQWLR